MSEHIIEVIEQALLALPGSFGLAIVLITAIAGNPGIIVLGALAAEGVVPFIQVIIWGVVGSLLTEVPWFFLGRVSARRYPRVLQRWLRRREPRLKNIRAIFFKHTLLAFFLARIFYGTKIASIVYAGHHRMHFWSFFRAILPITFGWILLLASIGWATGRSIALALNYITSTRIAFIFIVLVAAGIYWLFFRARVVVRRRIDAH